jgi:hypothetical protein
MGLLDAQQNPYAGMTPEQIMASMTPEEKAMVYHTMSSNQMMQPYSGGNSSVLTFNKPATDEFGNPNNVYTGSDGKSYVSTRNQDGRSPQRSWNEPVFEARDSSNMVYDPQLGWMTENTNALPGKKSFGQKVGNAIIPALAMAGGAAVGGAMMGMGGPMSGGYTGLAEGAAGAGASTGGSLLGDTIWSEGAIPGLGSGLQAIGMGGGTGATGAIGGAGTAANAAGSLLGGGSSLGAIAGGLLGSVGGSKQAGVTTTTQEPWSPMQPYLKDIAGAAQTNYNNQRTMSPQTQGILTQAQNMAQGQMNNPVYGQMQNAASGIMSGNSNLFGKVGNVVGGTAVGASSDVAGGFRSLGANDPTRAYSSLLTGNVTNPYLSNMAQDNFTMANRNLMENIMPGIGGSAIGAGQYGGSRQGIAQGLAASRLNQDVTSANNQMFGNAYQQAQNNMLNAANTLGGFSTQTGIANANNQTSAGIASANNATQASMANANNQLRGNDQQLSRMNSAMDWMNTGNNMQNTAIKNSLDLSNYGNNYSNNALNQYSNTINPMAGMGNQTSNPYFTNPAANVIGGATAGSQIFKNIFGS